MIPLFVFGALMQQRRVAAPDTLNRPGYRTAMHGNLELGRHSRRHEPASAGGQKCL